METKAKLSFVAGLILAVMWAGPALAKKSLNDSQLDHITAAGDPTVAVAQGSNATVNYADQSVFSLALPTGAQNGLRALTVQNVVGEVQLLVNLNVLAVSGDSAGTDQRNFSVQSWGSTAPLLSTSVAGVPGGNGGAGAAGGNSSITNSAPSSTQNLTNACSSQNAGCAGSTGGSTQPVDNSVTTGNASGGAGGAGGNAVPGIVAIGSGSADVIAAATCPGNDGSKCSNNTTNVTNSPTYSLALDQNAQVDMGALFIANIVGRAQTAFNINIAAAKLNLYPGDGSLPFADPMASTSGVIKQVNSGVQFRGSPLGFSPNANLDVSVTQTPN